MKSLVALWTALVRDAGNLYQIDTSRDELLVTRRHDLEGEPFLTITLDAFRVSFEAALENGTWDNVSIPGFRKDGRLPAFLRGFVSLVFQRNGQIRPTPDHTAVAVIRQLTGFAAKMRVECDPRYTERALRDYVTTDESATRGATPELVSVFASLFDGVMRDVEEEIDTYQLRVKHGDGGSEDKLLPNSRWKFPKWDSGFETLFPSFEYAHLNARHALGAGQIEFAETTSVRVSFVPKTAKGPRTIAVEPSWKMYAQQGLLSALTRSIESRGLPPRFTDSSVNRDLAREGSETGEWATIDLSAASDSVSARLVWELTAGRPLFREALFASRTGQASLPDGTTRSLNKFAGMGSATCFPIEAMVFAAIAVHALAPRLTTGQVSLPVDREVVRRVTVFGDDIVVPVTGYTAVRANLEAFGFKVNEKKSFHKGNFRESCGGDYFMGHSVAFVKVRQPLRFGTDSAIETTSTVSLRNQLAASGLWPDTVKLLDRSLLRGLGIFPYGNPKMPGLVRTATPWGGPPDISVHRHNSRLQRGEVKAWTEVSQFASDVLDGSEGLHKSLRLAERRDVVAAEPARYDVAGRAVRVRLNARWMPVA